MGEPKPKTGHAQRLVTEQIGLMALIASSLIDRLLLTGIMLRVWGVATFEIWAAAIAFAALVSLFEFGFNLYFYNQLTIEKERGDETGYRRTLGIANTIFVSMSALSLVFALGVIWSTDPTGSGGQWDAMLAATALCISATAKLVMCPLNALYRANREYARFAFISAFAEITRIVAVLVLVVTGFGLLGVAIGSTVATISICTVFVFLDTRRRFTPHRYVLAIPGRSELLKILRISSLYFVNLVPVTLWTALPVLYLQNLGLAAGMLASFVLVRTLANIARTPLQSMSVVYGQECGRRLAVDDLTGALRVVKSGARIFGVVSGLLSGLLVFGGRHITWLWTGSRDLYDAMLMTAAVLPMVLVTATLLVTNVLMCAQAPARPALARWVQMVITVLAYLLLPGLSPPLRMMVALAIGEIVGYAPLAYDAMARLIPGTGVLFHLSNCAIVVASIVLGGATVEGILYLVGTADAMSIIVGLALTGVLYTVYILMFAVGRDDRNLLWVQVVAPLIKRLQAKFGRSA